MFITMHCGGMPFNGETIAKQSLGGSETAAYYVAKELAQQGHKVTIFTNSKETGTFDGVRYEYAGEPNDQAPLGDRFTFYAQNTPCDVLIVQRHPLAFARKWASKINLWWVHDLALLRSKETVIGQMWNIDGVLCVSEFHKNQIAEVYGIPKEFIFVVNNGVDLALYSQPDSAVREKVHNIAQGKRALFYSSRPERGLGNLVNEGGIMEKLKDEPFHLFVCGYDNTTPQMAEEYARLWQRCEDLPNVSNLGALTKPELAQLQLACDAWVYPTEFEEVSCITAMEAMAAGCTVIASEHAAIPETCAGSAAHLIPLKDGAVNIEAFVTTLRTTMPEDPALQLRNANRACQLNWTAVANRMLDAAQQIFGKAKSTGILHHFIRHSDIVAIDKIGAAMMPLQSAFAETMQEELTKAYAFYRNDTFAQHYADYYQYEKNRGVTYGPEDISNNTRFNAVAGLIADLPAGSHIFDYGCAHGHYTINLAKRFPHLNFIGVDLALSNVETARKWAADEKLANVRFEHVNGIDDFIIAAFDGGAKYSAIIAAEVIEHVADPIEYVDTLASYLAPAGKMILTTPYGPWEAIGYREHGYWRAHLHHFEREDLHEMLGHHPGFKVLAVPSGQSPFASPIGSYITIFNKPIEPSRAINYHRKLRQTMPDQTLSCCMIVKDAEQDILRCLKSVVPHVQEVVIGVDCKTTDATREIIAEFAAHNPLVAFNVFDIDAATNIGFAAARNLTIMHASCDWILWIDSDEVLVGGEELPRYLRHSMYNGIAIKQHHMSQDPVAEIKVDLPCRIFRNHKGIQFFGLVHEHPEIVMNEGLGPTMIVPRPHIIHHGYTTEGVRRKRFSRNLPLLERDRKENPSRVLGKFLWVRDLAQSCQYELEDGIMNMERIKQRAQEAIKLFDELMDSKNWRIVLDSLPYYSQLVALTQDGVEMEFAIGQMEKAKGCFDSKERFHKLLDGLAEDKMQTFGMRYQ